MKNQKQKLVILSILFTSNNILYSITQLDGNVLYWTSSGTEKLKGAKKVTSTSITTSIQYIIRKIQSFGYKYVYVKVKGFSKNKRVVIKQLKQSVLNILFLSNKISFPHNGCKSSKTRRI